MHALLSLDGPPAANANLMLQLAMGIALLVGTWLARRQRYGWHQAFQTTVVVLQLVLIGLVMAPSFHTSRVLHGAWAHPGRAYFAVALAHALAGAAAAALGVYVVVSAGTRMLPAALRLRSYKPWMRTTLALWLVALGLGVATYAVWYHPRTPGQEQPVAVPPAAPAPAAPEPNVRITNFKFTPLDRAARVPFRRRRHLCHGDRRPLRPLRVAPPSALRTPALRGRRASAARHAFSAALLSVEGLSTARGGKSLGPARGAGGSEEAR